MGPKIPEGWVDSSRSGKPIQGTRFVAFKVPLKEALCNYLQPKDRFVPAMLLEEIPDLSLIIDLTNTNRYYDKNEFIENGIQHEKILCPGKIIPPPKLIKQFFDAVDKFMKSANAKDKYIGVHCTHGINRTGYFICNYMVHKLGFKTQDAINAFQNARGHEIVRQYLIDDLIKHAKTPPENRKDESIDNTRPYNNNHGSKRKWNHNSRTDNQHKDNQPKHKNKRNFDCNININIHPGNSGEPYAEDGPSHSHAENYNASFQGSSSKIIKKQDSDNRRYGNKPPNQKYNAPYKNRGNNRSQPRNSNTFRPWSDTWKQDPFYRNTQLNYYEDEPSRSNYNSKMKWSKKKVNS